MTPIDALERQYRATPMRDIVTEIDRLRAALGYYAAPETWWLHSEVIAEDNGILLTGSSRPIDGDNGDRARAALAGAGA